MPEAEKAMLIRVLSLNTWGVPVISRDRAARMRAIGRALGEVNADVVGLQEAFYAKDRRLLVEAARQAGLIYSHYFHSGLMGSGLLTFSRYPIVETGFLRFKLNGRPQDIVRVDYYAGKGVGRVRVRTPGGPLDVYNVHLIAPYLQWGPDRFAAHRVAQALEVGRYISKESEATPAILVGDLNCYPDDATYRALLAAGGLSETGGEADPLTAQFLPSERNGYATIHPPDLYDYVLSRSGPKHHLTPQCTRFILGGVPEFNPDGLKGYSDHYGILAEFQLLRAAQPLRVGLTPSVPLRTVVEAPFHHGIHGYRKHRRKARIVAAAASLGSAALVGGGQAIQLGSGGMLLIAILLAGLLVTGGLNLSTAARLTSETRTLTDMLAEEQM
jgi:sphingomyelin phosphodiesterase 2